MEKYGLPKGLVWRSSERTGSREMEDDDVLEWLKSAEQVGEIERRTESVALRALLESSRSPRKPSQSVKNPGSTVDVQVYQVDEQSPEISPLEKRAGPSGTQSKPQNNARQPFVFGSGKSLSGGTKSSNTTFAFGQNQPGSSGPSSDFSFSCKNATIQRVEPNQYCGFCKVILQYARALRLQPPACTSSGFGIHIEGGGCDCQNDTPYGRQVIDLFSYPHKTLDPVRKSARDGCHLCSILVGRGLPLDEPELDRDGINYGVAVLGRQSYDGPGEIILEKMRSNNRGKITLRKIELGYALRPKSLYASLHYPRTDSQPLFSMAKEWLRQCREDHKSCNKITTFSGFLPTRLLKITAIGGDVRSIKLCVTSELPNRDISYLALSHRWGGHSTSLLSENYDDLLKDVPIRSLPQNFLDAARITSNMGFAYLWIDSLCIIQDSPVDKAREIPAMSEIYGHALLTIAALAAENSNGGCFMSRYPLSLVPALLRDGDSGTRDQVWAEPEKSRAPSSDGNRRPPLHTRGWVVQERALAPRTLNFGADMVHWECIEAVADEASPEMIKDANRLSNRSPFGMGLKCALDMVHQDTKAGLGYEHWGPFWWRIVREYTASNLTYNSDKWNAIASLAKQAEKAVREGPTPNRLFFGLWGRNLAEELMWKIRKPGKRIDPADFKAPTWSWLSVDAAVIEQRFDFEKVHARMAAAEADTKARLSFDGLGATNKAIVHGCLFDLDLEFNTGMEGNHIYGFQSVRGQGRAFSKDDYAFQWWPDAHPENSEGLAILPMVRGKWEGDDCSGLVLRPSDPAKLSWERVGCFRLTPVGRRREGSTKHFDGKWEAIILV